MKKNKNYLKLFISFLFALLIINQINAQEVSLKPYGIKSGIIDYKYSGSQVGTGILYFDDYGYKSAMKMDTKMNDKPNKGWVISLKEYQYMFDPAQPDKGLKMKNPMIESLLKMDKPDFDKVAEDLYSKMGMKRVGTEKFMDKDGIVFKSDMGKSVNLEWHSNVNGYELQRDKNKTGSHINKNKCSCRH